MKMATEIVVSLETHHATCQRVFRSALAWNPLWWGSIMISVGCYAFFVLWQQIGNISFNPRLSHILIHVAFALAVVIPHCVLYYIYGHPRAPTTPLDAVFTEDNIILKGPNLRCVVPWDTVVTALKRSGWIILAMRYPFGAVVLKKTDTDKQEPRLRSLFVQKGIRCHGQWTPIQPPTPPPL